MHPLLAYIAALLAQYNRLTVVIFVHVKIFKPSKQQKILFMGNAVHFQATLEVIAPLKSKVTHQPIRRRDR